MAVERLTISLDPGLAKEIADAAGTDGESVSAWMAEAARCSLKRHALLAVISEWEAAHGQITDQELADARRRLRWEA